MVVSSIINFTVGQSILKRLFNTNPFNAFLYAAAFYPEFFKKILPEFLKIKKKGK